MVIYLLRHGQAETGRGLPDQARALTAEGREQVRRVLDKAPDILPSLIVTSPLKRAVETGEIAAEVLGATQPLGHSEALEPDSSPESLWEDVRLRLKGRDQVLLVGHEPLLSAAAAYFLGCLDLRIGMRTAAMVAIGFDDINNLRPRGVLLWMAVP